MPARVGGRKSSSKKAKLPPSNFKRHVTSVIKWTRSRLGSLTKKNKDVKTKEDEESCVTTYTTTELHPFQHLWRIEKLVNYFESSFPGPPVLNSLLFSPPNSDLKLFLEFKAKSTADPRSVSLHLRMSQPDPAVSSNPCLVFKISLLDILGERRHSRGLIKEFSTVPAKRTWGWDNFLPAATCLDPDGGLLHDGHALVVCADIQLLDCVDISKSGADGMVPPAPEVSRRSGDTLLEWKSRLYQDGLPLSDVLLVFDDEPQPQPQLLTPQLRAHKLILTSASPVFHTMFVELNHQCVEAAESRVNITGTSMNVFRHLLEYVYTDECKALKEPSGSSCDTAGAAAQQTLIMDLLKAADKYQLDYLKCKCEDWLARQLHLGNSDRLVALADTFNAAKLKIALGDFFRKKARESLDAMLTAAARSPQKASRVLAQLSEMKEPEPNPHQQQPSNHIQPN